MSRTTSTVAPITRTGVTPSLAAVNGTDGNAFANDGRCALHVKNAGAQMTVTVQTPGTVDGLAITDLVVTIPATTGEKLIGPFPPGIYNQSDGMVYVDFSRGSDVTLEVLSL